jgi:hypothetical protein
MYLNEYVDKHYKTHMVRVNGIYKRRIAGRPTRSEELALKVADLYLNKKLSLIEIARLFGWGTQIDDYGKETHSRTVSRYLNVAYNILEQKRNGTYERPRFSSKQ